MTWRIYYDDRPPFDHTQGGPQEAPALGVQIIIQVDDRTGRYNQTGSDYYIWRDNRWWGVDIFGLWDYLSQPGWKAVLFGRTIANDRYREIFARAEADSDFPPRSAYLPGERKL